MENLKYEEYDYITRRYMMMAAGQYELATRVRIHNQYLSLTKKYVAMRKRLRYNIPILLLFAQLYKQKVYSFLSALK